MCAVSVLIPVRNAAHVIGRQLDALAQQVDAPPFEIVLADNGSTDALAEVVASWSSRLKIRSVDASTRRGASHARNVAARAATADILAFCDVDDRVGPRWVRAYATSVRPGMVATGPLLVEGDDADHQPFLQGSHVSSGNFAIHRSTWLASGGFREDVHDHAAEMLFSWSLWDAEIEGSYVDDALVVYTRRDRPSDAFASGSGGAGRRRWPIGSGPTACRGRTPSGCFDRMAGWQAGRA